VPSEQVQRLRAVYDEWERGNFAAGRELLAPDVKFVTFSSEGDDLTFYGPAGVAEWMRDFLQTWAGLRIQAYELLESGERVLAICHQRAKGRQSGVEVEMEVYAVWQFRNSKVVLLHWLRSREEAMKLAGLDPAF
jgi:ketosteroid isomerase-like protein